MKANDRRYVIVGGSVAGVNAVKAIRQHDERGSIVLLSDEPYPPYSRPLITYYLAGRISEERLFYLGNDFYERHGVIPLLGEKAVRIDTGERIVCLASGKTVPYDRLLLANGGKPIIPKIECDCSGSSEPEPGRGRAAVAIPGFPRGVFTLTTFRDALAVKEFIRTNDVKTVLVIGGGLIGLKATEAFVDMGIPVVIVELADRILSTALDLTASGLIESALRQIGCEIITGDSVAGFDTSKGGLKGALTAGGRYIRCDLAILAIGVRPNLDLVRDTPIEAGGPHDGTRRPMGIAVDPYMRTNVGDVFAAGDVTMVYDLVNDANRNIAIWPNASRQGRTAGENMAGGSKVFPGVFAMNSVELCGLPCISLGLVDPPESDVFEVLQLPQHGVYRKLVLKDGRLVGAILLGNIERAGLFASLIAEQIDVSGFREHLLSDGFGLIHFPKRLRERRRG